MVKIKKYLNNLIATILIAAMVCPNIIAATGAFITMTPDDQPYNHRIGVGMSYYEIWKNSSDVWTSDGAPGDEVNVDSSFSYTSTKKIKSISVRKYNMDGTDHKIWDKTRTKSSGTYTTIEPYMADVEDVVKTGEDGIHTNTATINIRYKAILTTTHVPDHKGETQTKWWQGANVEGLRYYLPCVVEVELEDGTIEVLVQHFNRSTGVKLDEEKVPIVEGKTITASTKPFEGLNYDKCQISYDDGATWAKIVQDISVTETITKKTLIRFYYVPPGTDPFGITATLVLSANPSAIKAGQTANVQFTLKAGASSKNPIVSYQFFFGPESDSMSSLGSGSSNVKTTSKSGVEPNTTWYGKVTVTDSKGNKADAYASVDITELEDATAFAKIQSATIEPANASGYQYKDLANYIDHIEYNEDRSMTVYLQYSEDLLPKKDASGNVIESSNIFFKLTPDATRSWATNGVGEYRHEAGGDISMMGGNSSTHGKAQTLSGPMDTLDDIIFYLEYYDVEYIYKGGTYETDLYLTVNDRVQTSVTAEMDDPYVIYYKVKEPDESTLLPTVDLQINKKQFIREETALFNVVTTENAKVPIIDKDWKIEGANGYSDSGTGEIPKNYFLNTPTGDYKATQYIYYKDKDGQKVQLGDSEDFTVLPFFKPDVSITTDKDKYVVPTDVLITTTFTEDSTTYKIEKKTWSIETKTGTVVASGDGVCPTIKHFDLESTPGFYVAKQTIYWKEYGDEFSKTAEKEFKLISPIPAADFTVQMQMSKDLANKVWQNVTTDDPNKGKQFKQIRIDLTPSVKLNQDLENPYPIDFNSANTQITITPITSDGTAQELDRNTYVHTYTASDKVIVSNIITISGRQYVDVRFDDYGRYRVRARVANSTYTGVWLSKDIVIRQDMPPKVGISFRDVQPDGASFKTFRQDDLRVRFGINTTATSQDEDAVDFSTGKLEIRFDYNTDGDTSNDGVHSSMYITKSADSVQPYVTATKNTNMDDFYITMYDGANPILGKIRLEYSVGKDPVIPYFTGGDLPVFVYPRGDTYSITMDKKIVLADNKAGMAKIIVGKEGKLEIIIFNYDTDIPHVQAEITKIIDKYKGQSNTKVYVIDKNGNKELVN